QKIKSDGSMELEIDDIIQKLIDAFLGSASQIPTAIGYLLEKSNILKDTYNRLPLDVQNHFLEKVANQIPPKIGGILLKSKGFLG
ncbi:MAG: hypothetical protein WD512_09965, partial [Candidatus Paceibacterota bacterium]